MDDSTIKKNDNGPFGKASPLLASHPTGAFVVLIGLLYGK
jgi:hypothetical protein